MGRKPNQLVLEFFNRGRKLEDASNRYEHTCKRCGELFPKGRIDSLMGHLLRRCPNVTQLDRETVFFYLQQNPATRPSGTLNTGISGTKDPISQPPVFAPQQAPFQVPQNHSLYGGPLPLDQQQSALDTLAEVSRRHLDYSRPLYAGQHEQSAIENERALAEQALIFQLQQVSTGIHHSATSAESSGLSLSAPQLPEERVDFESSAHINTEPRQHIAQIQRSADRPASSEQIDPDLCTIEVPLGQQLHGTDNQVTPEEIMMWNPTNPSGRQTFGALSAPSMEPSPGFGLLSKYSKSKTRGRFTDSRRKEVQETRKRGACIRCRMLKKPCSDGTPCNTCAHVESARLWKGTCLRMRLVEVFGLWSSGLFHTKAKIEVPAAVQGLRQMPLSGRIEARFFAKSELCMTFAAKQYDGLTDPGGHGSSIWLLDEGESMSTKVEEYIRRLCESNFEDERSAFMSATVQRAQSMIRNEQSEILANKSPQGATGRSCYNLQTELLGNTVELWLETSILTDPDAMALELRYVPDLSPQSSVARVDWSADGYSGTQALAAESCSYGLLRSQLLAATESRCSRLAKTIINELERRLLQRQQVSRSATFLSAVILLNSVERITGFYRTFDNDGLFEPQLGITSWPMDDPPSKLWPQGERFAELLVMLLRMRGLPPKTITKPEGILAVVRDGALPVQINGEPIKEQADGQVLEAAAWLDALKLSVGGLVAKQGSPAPSRDAEVREWDMRFVARLLLPESAK